MLIKTQNLPWKKRHWSLTADFHRDSWDTFCSTAVSSSLCVRCVCAFLVLPPFLTGFICEISSQTPRLPFHIPHILEASCKVWRLSLSLHMNFLAETIWGLLKDCLTSVALPDSNLKRANSIAQGLCKEWNNELYAKTGTEAYENSSCPMHITLSQPHLHIYFIA